MLSGFATGRKLSREMSVESLLSTWVLGQSWLWDCGISSGPPSEVKYGMVAFLAHGHSHSHSYMYVSWFRHSSFSNWSSEFPNFPTECSNVAVCRFIVACVTCERVSVIMQFDPEKTRLLCV